MLCQQSNAGEMVPFTLREQADGVGVVLEGVFSDSPETQPSDNTLQQSHSSRRWDTLLKLYIQKRIWKSEKNNDRRQTADPQNIIVFDKNKVVRIGCECETVNGLKKREGGKGGRFTGTLSRQTNRQRFIWGQRLRLSIIQLFINTNYSCGSPHT